MEDSTLIIVVCYFIPMIVSMLACYFSDDVETLGDLIRASWLFSIPFLNIVVFLAIIFFLLEIFWSRIRNIKIK